MRAASCAVAAPAESAATCVRYVADSSYDPCDGLACYGYNSQTGWQTCVPPEPCDVLLCPPPCHYNPCPPPVEEQGEGA